MKLKFLLFSAFFFFSFATNAQKKGLHIGLYHSFDLNITRFYDGGYSNVGNRGRLGVSDGAMLEWGIGKRIAVNIGGMYAKKVYYPERGFERAILNRAEVTVTEIPFNIKYTFSKKLKEKISFYTMMGIVHQVQKTHIWEMKNQIEGVYHENKYLFKSQLVNISVGANYKLKSKLSLRSEVNYRGYNCHCEYLNRYFDKIGLAILLMVDL
ncbi:MAG: outer membrane beta-barrel protein [Bacteroidetes bacterium]|nr:outer membrane beta-barrel protein [Bacteroidota bacterium]